MVLLGLGRGAGGTLPTERALRAALRQTQFQSFGPQGQLQLVPCGEDRQARVAAIFTGVSGGRHRTFVQPEVCLRRQKKD